MNNKNTLTYKTCAIAILATLLFSCVSQATRAFMDEYNRTIPTCIGERDCKLKMAVAREWVLANSTIKLWIDNEDRILTDRTNTLGGSRHLTAKVNREPIDNETYEIRIVVSCSYPA